MARSTVHYADNETNNILKRLHNKLRPAGTPVQRVEYIIELLLLRIFEVKLKHEETFQPLRKLFGKDNYTLLFTHLLSLTGEQIKAHLNQNIFPFYASILSKSRKIFSENLPQKVQDQLVLIEEVFANSSFSTNVQSGNMSEIINLVAEIDEHRILKTDLLGDAIESALSETGGTRDIGLFRTPDHIRQMMVALANPDFSDTIFDPACGSGGFLFDSYQYVLENATKDGKWPGERTHPEIKEYFKNYFSKTPSNIPSKDIATHFYRAGIGGIEYLGMIRKMAAINLYVRNLNPQNIQQGDSLKMFDPLTDANTKSIVIANPPFGAERDQPAYPNVWEEYSRESETTILFVKLMFELLKSKGRCAVVVSEGFLTWSQNSARALRRKLLEEANLKAIISLPQGVFVSKNGQGAKTSILYFEKGEPTQWIWCYKIDNDGYSLGVNRKVISGCQIPEVIELFTQHVKKRIIPPETKQRFVIPAEWVKTLDPRVKEKITHETKEELLAEQNDARKKLEEKLTAQLNKKTLDKKEYAQKLWQFENVWENKIQNETAKRIEREYAYSFNLQNYRSNLSNEQRDSWKKEFVKIKPLNNSSLDERYEHLQDADIKTALSILASFEPNNALHIDIAREYLNTVKEKDKTFQRLDEILKKGHKYPFVSLNDYLLYQSEKIKPI
ncbi:MAG: SAM-dependent DNA methyltransferase, partial [Ignavibacteriales bacterium]|nr:SAM-dependent DNA methyltransferase [Ignavibacteriales bacterium]